VVAQVECTIYCTVLFVLENGLSLFFVLCIAVHFIDTLATAEVCTVAGDMISRLLITSNSECTSTVLTELMEQSVRWNLGVYRALTLYLGEC
jgi:hypothetical protein